MKTVISSIVFCFVLMSGLTQAATDGWQEAAVKTTFLVIYRPGPAWPPGKTLADLPLGEHGKYMLSLYVKGSMKLAGPLTDDAGGVVVLEAANASEAKAIVVEDPAVKAEIFAYEIHPWRMVEWEKYIKK